jgi:cytochrome c heme-lyase
LICCFKHCSLLLLLLTAPPPFVVCCDACSPLARIRSWLTGELPFDRHDWVVDRCGTEVRYVIDFYFYDDKAGTAEAFEVVTRPALDSPTAALDRVKMGVYRKFAEWGLPCPVTGTASGRFGSAPAPTAAAAAAGQS